MNHKRHLPDSSLLGTNDSFLSGRENILTLYQDTPNSDPVIVSGP